MFTRHGGRDASHSMKRAYAPRICGAWIMVVVGLYSMAHTSLMMLISFIFSRITVSSIEG